MLQVPKLIKTVVSSRYTHPELGPVNVRVVATARSLRARWEGPVLHVTIPKDCPASAFDRFIDNNIPAFLEMKPEQEFHIGQIIDGDYARTAFLDLLGKLYFLVYGNQRSTSYFNKIFVKCLT